MSHERYTAIQQSPSFGQKMRKVYWKRLDSFFSGSPPPSHTRWGGYEREARMTARGSFRLRRGDWEVENDGGRGSRMRWTALFSAALRAPCSSGWKTLRCPFLIQRSFMPKLPWPSRLEHYHDFRFQRQFILARSARLPENKHQETNSARITG